MKYLDQNIESLIFTAKEPISLQQIKTCLEEVFKTKFKKDDLIASIENLKKRYQKDEFSFELVEISKGFQFLSKGVYHNVVGTFLKQITKKRLSRSAIETLAIIAYKQPIIRSEIEKIRGVSCDYAMKKLLEKELVAITGRSDGPGRPLLYGTGIKFMDYFGLKDLSALPKPKDFKEVDNTIGEPAPIEESIEKSIVDNKNDDSVENQENSNSENPLESLIEKNEIVIEEENTNEENVDLDLD